MKRTFLMGCITLGITFFLGANIGFAEDAPKTGDPKQACFEKMDADKNGQITEAEFLENCKNRFSSMDTDKNGSLGNDEFKPCCMNPMMNPMPEKGKECPYMKNNMK